MSAHAYTVVYRQFTVQTRSTLFTAARLIYGAGTGRIVGIGYDSRVARVARVREDFVAHAFASRPVQALEFGAEVAFRADPLVSDPMANVFAMRVRGVGIEARFLGTGRHATKEQGDQRLHLHGKMSTSLLSLLSRRRAPGSQTPPSRTHALMIDFAFLFLSSDIPISFRMAGALHLFVCLFVCLFHGAPVVCD